MRKSARTGQALLPTQCGPWATARRPASSPPSEGYGPPASLPGAQPTWAYFLLKRDLRDRCWPLHGHPGVQAPSFLRSQCLCGLNPPPRSARVCGEGTEGRAVASRASLQAELGISGHCGLAAARQGAGIDGRLEEAWRLPRAATCLRLRWMLTFLSELMNCGANSQACVANSRVERDSTTWKRSPPRSERGHKAGVWGQETDAGHRGGTCLDIQLKTTAAPCSHAGRTFAVGTFNLHFRKQSSTAFHRGLCKCKDVSPSAQLWNIWTAEWSVGKPGNQRPYGEGPAESPRSVAERTAN